MSLSTASDLLTRLDTSLRTPSGKFLLIALATTAMTATTILSAQSIKRQTRKKKLKKQIEEEYKDDEEEEMIDFADPKYSYGAGAGAGTVMKRIDSVGGKGKKKKVNEIIVRESLARNYVFFGEEGMGKIRDSLVVVVGVGGVGSAVATMLVRSGVGRIRIIDFDQVSLSSLNRHSTATLAQVGTPKVFSCKEYYEAVAPWVEVDARVELFGKDVADELLEGNPDYVVDCIDNIDSKIELLAYCHGHKIPVFSSLGAASKSDPSMIQVSDISCTFEDPLARSVRRRLKLLGIHSGIPVVYSTEKPREEIALLPLPDEEYAKGKVGELSSLANFRVRILPVLGPLPAMFGNAAASYVLQELAGFEMETLPIKNRKRAAANMHRQLSTYQQTQNGTNKIPLSEDDVLYLFEEIHRGRSVVPPHGPPTRPILLPWIKSKGLEWDNLVVFERGEGNEHEEHCLKGNEDPAVFWGAEVEAFVEKRAREERRLRAYRL